jgi:DNA helicase HerA-like ATPase
MDLADIRIKEHFGLVTNDTNTTQFSFLVSPPKNRETIEKHDTVCFNHPKYGEACQVIAEVKEMTSYEQVAGSTIGERVGKMLAIAKVIGYIDLRCDAHPIRKLLVPPNPGSRVYMPYASFLEDVLNRGTNGEAYAQPLYIGKTEIVAASQEADDLQVSCYLDAADLTSKHTLICAMDGAGKTHLATVILEELANKTGHPILVLDPNNEYSTVGTTSRLEKNYPFSFQTEIVNVDTKNSPEAIIKKIRAGQVAVITAEGLTLTEKSAFYTNILNMLAERRREKTVQPFLLVVEDAENLPIGAIQEVLGSKNGIATLLISSNPVMLGGRVLSKMGIQIAGRTIDPENMVFLKNIIEGSEEQLSCLRVGEWVVNGLNIGRPLKVHVRERYSRSK